MTFSELLARYSPSSRWELPGIGVTASASTILGQHARFGDYLDRAVEYLAPYAMPADDPNAHVDRGGCIARKVR